MGSLKLHEPDPDGTVDERLLYIGMKEHYLRRLKHDLDILRGIDFIDMDKQGIAISVFKNLAELSDVHLSVHQKELIKTTIISVLEIKYMDIFNELKNMLKDGE